LRTREDISNFTTVKVIGKGAFGEVRLVQRKRDGKIYALKSLVKSEMVKMFAGQTASLADILCSSNVNSLPMCGQNVIS